MIKQVIGFTAMCLVFVACNSNSDKKQINETNSNDSLNALITNDCKVLYTRAKASDDILMRAVTIDKGIAAKAISDFNLYATTCKDDSLSPIFFIKAGQVAQAIGSFTQAQAMFSKCINQYPHFKNKGAALFLSAQLYDDSKMLNNETEAKKLYEQIIFEFPKSPFANDATACIKNLGKTDEEIMQGFLKKSK